MLINELYTQDFWREGRYAPEYDEFVTKAFADNSKVVQAQQYVPVGGRIGAGKLGKVFEVITDEGGMSPSREFFGDVDPQVAEGTPVTVFMGINSEKVTYDVGQVGVHGYTEHDRNLNLATARLQKTFTYKLFNADTNETMANGKKYEFDGYRKYFDNNPEQVDHETLVLGDFYASPNLRYIANDKLNSVNKLIDVNGDSADIIYTTTKGAAILAALESEKTAYTGPYKFTQNVQTYNGLPVVSIPDSCVPEIWRHRGEFVLFANQDKEQGCRIMVPDNGNLIVTYAEANTGFQKHIPMDMIFALVAVNPKAASLCFVQRGTAPVDPGVEG
jgi:hypothetical protein